ncbi:MAG: hypothetical protein LBL79_11645 [Prevotella sp.]|jgi:hypothetical protein|nr:hypothetical protein [Prevotella sp.]
MKNDTLSKVYDRIDSLIDSDYEFSLSDNIGLCVLFANKYKQSGDQKYYAVIKKSLNSLINVKEYPTSDIITGSSGVLWLLKYLKKLEVIDFSDSNIELLENGTVHQFKTSLSIHNWDYHTGAIGHLLALDHPSCYKDFLDYLKMNIIKDKNGNYSLLSVKYNESTNLGLHAGILGVLSVMNCLIQKGCLVKESVEIRKKILQIIFGKLQETKNRYFPALYHRDYPCRMCWTYGELALSLQLLGTSIVNNDKALEQEALSIAINAMKRDTLKDTMIRDSCFISGTSGNYLMFRLLDECFPSKGFEKAMDLWSDYTSGLLVRHDFFNIDRHTQNRKTDLSILEGLCGICLSFENFDYSWYEYALLGVFTLDNRGTENLKSRVI